MELRRLRIMKKNNYSYLFSDESDSEYVINIEFMDIEKAPELGDYIYMNEELLNPQYEGYSTFYTFGSLNNQYGKENIAMDDVDVIKVILEDKEIWLKRLYG